MSTNTPVMNSFSRFCLATRKPVDIFAFVCSTTFLFSSSTGAVHSFLHRWRIPLLFLITFCIIIQIVNFRTRKTLSKEPNHA